MAGKWKRFWEALKRFFRKYEKPLRLVELVALLILGAVAVMAVTGRFTTEAFEPETAFYLQDGEYYDSRAAWGTPFDEAKKALRITSAHRLGSAYSSEQEYERTGTVRYGQTRVITNYRFADGALTGAQYTVSTGVDSKLEDAAPVADVWLAALSAKFGEPDSDITRANTAGTTLTRTILWEGETTQLSIVTVSNGATVYTAAVCCGLNQ